MWSFRKQAFESPNIGLKAGIVPGRTLKIKVNFYFHIHFNFLVSFGFN